MLNRPWTWTSGPTPPAGSGLPFGPLRFRAWTSPRLPAALPFGALRFYAWTSGPAVPPVIPEGGGGGGILIRTEADRLRALRLLRDDELLLFVVAGSASLGLLD